MIVSTKEPYRRRRLAGIFTLCVVLSAALSVIPTAARAAYLLGPGDLLKVTVFKNTDLSLDVRVSDAGAINYPLIGAVPVSGLTLAATERKIAKLLQDGGFVVNPQISILLTQGFNDLVSVIGEVNKAGRYSVEAAGGHLSGMIASAGGISPAGGEVVTVTGERNGKTFRRDIDIVKMSAGVSGAEDMELAGGDTLFVKKAPLFYIYGQVQKPGQFPLEDGMTVMQALATGGGVTGKGTQRGIVRHRRDASGKVKEESVSLDDDVRDEDVIYVKESLF
ncbi:MAG: polysaccharide export protein EpsE [Steroidobacteraceae bacterium]|jgi:polysaccharide export outer membrane protein